MSSAYDDFLDILKKFRTLSLVALGTGAAVPFFAFVAKIAPPWPPGIMLLTALTELVCLIVVFQFLRTRGRSTVNRAIAILAPMLFLASFAYLTLISFFTYVTPHTDERFAKGFVCKQQIQQLHPDLCPLVNRDVLADAQWNADEIWTEWSIDLMQLFIASLWIASGWILTLGARV
jgi:hypothetical protein